MKKLIFLLLLSATLHLTVCQAENHPPYAIGFATPSGNQIWVAAQFDNRTWSTPVGSLACCWGETGKTSLIFDRPLPKDIYVNWLEEATKTRYEATIVLPTDIDDRARKLPGYLHVPTNRRRERFINLIVGLAPGGKLTIWLANAPYVNENLKGRVLDVIAQGQAIQTTEIAPYPRARSNENPQGVR